MMVACSLSTNTHLVFPQYSYCSGMFSNVFLQEADMWQQVGQSDDVDLEALRLSIEDLKDNGVQLSVQSLEYLGEF